VFKQGNDLIDRRPTVPHSGDPPSSVSPVRVNGEQGLHNFLSELAIVISHNFDETLAVFEDRSRPKLPTRTLRVSREQPQRSSIVVNPERL
jgi:hypothetical protein